MTKWNPVLSDTGLPAYRAIADALASDVREGRLAPGDRLPTQRELAELLNVSIGTVTRAYAEAERRGLVSAEVGRGTFVRDLEVEGATSGQRGDSAGGIINLSLSYPIESENPDLATALRVIADRADVSQLLRYEAPRAAERHVNAGVAWLKTCGLVASPDLVTITVGAQHAITVILSAVTNPGDLVLADQITFSGFIRSAKHHGVRLQGVTMDEEGMMPDALRDACKKEKARALFCIPTIHNPTTAAMSAVRRSEIAAIAEEFGLYVIEDDPYRFLMPDAPPPISTLVPDRSFFLVSMSKALAGGLRVAYVASPRDAAEQLRDKISLTVWSVPPLTAALATLWIEDGTAHTIAQRKRAEAEARQMIAREMLSGLQFNTQPGSYYLWLGLPPSSSSTEFAYGAHRRGVAVSPSAAFTVGSVTPPNAVRVCVSAVESRARLRTGLGILSEMVKRSEYHQAPLV